jgi:membrane-associated protease RseP (regulator of RpoE activity)
MDVMLHQVAWAGWAGILVTALNLIPVGQLDGGHILNSLLGKNARKVVPVIIGLLVLLGFVWSGWWLWAAIIFFMSRIPASPLDTITKIDKKRKRLGLVMMIIFILVFTPVPIMVIF